jgi:predicted AlkP superfamily phosphohydrolase/phosphomutase
VNWKKTKAYALGTGQIYINLSGREGQGVVKPGEEYNRLIEEIVTGLSAVRDPLDDHPVIKAVYRGKEVFTGAYRDKAPDLQLGFHDGYRTSKETMLGGIPPELFSNNMNKWSGDHSSSAVDETSGILLANRKILKNDPHLVDVAATVLEHFNVAKLPEMEGSSIFQVAGGIADIGKP